MLETVMQSLNNWFLVGRYDGTYTIEDGEITLPFLIDGQYFRIVGSILNDGVYQYSDALILTDETFDGSVWALAPPKAFLELVADIEKWQTEYADKVASPYTSESFGGYSYTKSSGGTTEAGMNSWQDAFRKRLNQWRKLGNTTFAKPNPHTTPPLPRQYNPWR